MSEKLKAFISYAQEDEEIVRRLYSFLSTESFKKVIDVWYDNSINAGAEWNDEIIKKLEESDVILLVISNDFQTSKYIQEHELKIAIEKHENKKALVIPIKARVCDWSDTPLLRLQAIPRGEWKDTIDSAKNKDEIYYDVALLIRKSINDYFDKAKDIDFFTKEEILDLIKPKNLWQKLQSQKRGCKVSIAITLCSVLVSLIIMPDFFKSGSLVQSKETPIKHEPIGNYAETENLNYRNQATDSLKEEVEAEGIPKDEIETTKNDNIEILEKNRAYKYCYEHKPPVMFLIDSIFNNNLFTNTMRFYNAKTLKMDILADTKASEIDKIRFLESFVDKYPEYYENVTKHQKVKTLGEWMDAIMRFYGTRQSAFLQKLFQDEDPNFLEIWDKFYVAYQDIMGEQSKNKKDIIEVANSIGR